VVISLSLNDSSNNILNDILKIYGLVGSLLFTGFCVFGGFLVSVILSSVIPPAGDMVLCFSSSQISGIHLTFFKHIFSLRFESFHKKTSVIGRQLAFWLLTNLLFSLFWGAYNTPLSWVLLFQNTAVVPKVAQYVVPMQIRCLIHHIRTGPLHIFKLFSSWICMSRQTHKITSGQIRVSSHRFETQGIKTQAGSLFYTEHNQQQTSQPKQLIISTFHYLQMQKWLPDRVPITAFSTKLKNNSSDYKYV